MKSVYVVVTQSGTGVSKILKFITKDKYNHASICLSPSFEEFYSFGRRKINNPFTGGFVVENAFTHVFGKFSKIPCMIIEKQISDEQYEKLQSNIKEVIKNRDAYTYAYLGLFLADTKLSVLDDHKFFCSQFVAKMLNDIGVSTPKVPEHIHPIDFKDLKDSKIIYEGELKYFCKEGKYKLENKIYGNIE